MSELTTMLLGQTAPTRTVDDGVSLDGALAGLHGLDPLGAIVVHVRLYTSHSRLLQDLGSHDGMIVNMRRTLLVLWNLTRTM